jgi:hypothetical protein
MPPPLAWLAAGPDHLMDRMRRDSYLDPDRAQAWCRRRPGSPMLPATPTVTPHATAAEARQQAAAE